MENRRRTKNFFPEPAFQLRLLALLVGGALVQVITTSVILYYFLNQNYELLVKYAALDSELTEILFSELRLLVWVIGALFLTFMVGITVLGILFSHRVAGPMYAMKRTLRQTLEGKEVFLKLRKGDEFMDVADDLNRLIEIVISKKDKNVRSA